MKYLLFFMLLISGCSSISDNTGNRQFLNKLDAEIYAKKMRFHGYKATVRHYNWYMLGGYPWDVKVEGK